MGPSSPHSSPIPPGALPARAQMAPTCCAAHPEKHSLDHPQGWKPCNHCKLFLWLCATARPKRKPNKADFKVEKVKVRSFKATPHVANTSGAAAHVCCLKFGEKNGKCWVLWCSKGIWNTLILVTKPDTFNKNHLTLKALHSSGCSPLGFVQYLVFLSEPLGFIPTLTRGRSGAALLFLQPQPRSRGMG